MPVGKIINPVMGLPVNSIFTNPSIGKFPVGNGVIPNTVDLDGTNDYFLRSSDLAGNADNNFGLVQGWFKIDGGDGTKRVIYGNENVFYQIFLGTDNKLAISVFTVSPAVKAINMISDTVILAGSGWHHFVAEFQISTTSLGSLYLDDILQTDTTFINSVLDADYTRAKHAVGSVTSGLASHWHGCLADIYIHNSISSLYGLGNVPLRRKFITASVTRVGLGDNGEIPAGQPIIYLNGDKDTFGANLGSGGVLASVGSPSDCIDNPPE